MNFGKTLLDVPIAIKGNKLLPPYEPPKPVPKPRQRKKALIALPRKKAPIALPRNKTLSDEPIWRRPAIKGNKLLPKPLQPTPYEPPKPVPKPRQRKKAPIALPRNRLPMKVREKVKKLIDEISPYYSPEAISQFKVPMK